jgi:pyruvate-ferredoxin/flavodoxin oxidoreductase
MSPLFSFGKDDSSPRYPGDRVVTDGRGAVRIYGAGDGERPGLAALAGRALAGERASAWIEESDFLAGIDSLREATERHIPFVAHVALSGADGHRAYHAAEGAGCLQFFARDAQEAADLSLIAHRIAEAALLPCVVAQDGAETASVVETILRPDDAMAAEFLGSPADWVETPTPAQRLLFGDRRRLVPELWSVRKPLITGANYGPEADRTRGAGQIPYFLDHAALIADAAFKEFAELSGRAYGWIGGDGLDGADVVVVAQGSAGLAAEAAARALREAGTRAGSAWLRAMRPFPDNELRGKLSNAREIVALERLGLAHNAGGRLSRELRASLYGSGAPTLRTLLVGRGGLPLDPARIAAAVRSGDEDAPRTLGVHYADPAPDSPKDEIERQTVLDAYPKLAAPQFEELAPIRAATGSLRLRLLGAPDPALLETAKMFLGRLAERSDVHARAQTGCGPGVLVTLSPEPLGAVTPETGADVAVSIAPDTLNHPADSARISRGGTLILGSGRVDPARAWRELPEAGKLAASKKGIHVLTADLRGHGTKGSFPEGWSKALCGFLYALADIDERLLPPAELRREDQRDPLVRAAGDSLTVALSPQEGEDDFHNDPPRVPAGLSESKLDGAPVSSVHRQFTRAGRRLTGGKTPAFVGDPFLASGWSAPDGGRMRDLGRQRLKRPALLADRCTGCGACWTACPDSALTVRVNPAVEIFEAAAANGGSDRLPRVLRAAEAIFASEANGGKGSFAERASEAVLRAARETSMRPEDRQSFKGELDELLGRIRSHAGAITEPFYRDGGRAGVLSIAVDPERCTGCLGCVSACPEQALAAPDSASEATDDDRATWAFTAFLPSPDAKFLPGEKPGPNPASILLDPAASEAAVGGAEGPSGDSKRLAARLFAGVGTGTLKPRFAEHAKALDSLAGELEEKMRLALSVGIDDPDALGDALKSGAQTRAEITSLIDREGASVDPARLARGAEALASLRSRRDELRAGLDRRGALLGAAFDSRLDALRYPYAPYAFPCAWIGKGRGPELAAGIADAHLRRLTRWIKAERVARLELDDKYRAAEHDPFFERFSWKDFTPEELALCPPLLLIGDAEDLFGRGLGALSALLDSRAPVKVLALDAPAAPTRHALVSLAHRDVFVLHGGFGDGDRLLEGLASAFASPRPAVAHLICPVEPARGVADGAYRRGADALASRLKPFFVYDPGRGEAPHERLSLEGNPEPESDWKSRVVTEIEEDGSRSETETTTTPADYLATDPDWSAEFTLVPRRSWSGRMVSVSEFLELDEDERAEAIPFVWLDGNTGSPERARVSAKVVAVCESRLAFWRLLNRIARNDIAWPDEDAIASKARDEVVEKVAVSLAELAGEGAHAIAREARL